MIHALSVPLALLACMLVLWLAAWSSSVKPTPAARTRTFVGGWTFARELVETLGLPHVRSLTIRVPCNDLVTIDAEFLPDEEQAEALKQTFALCRAERLAR